MAKQRSGAAGRKWRITRGLPARGEKEAAYERERLKARWGGLEKLETARTIKMERGCADCGFKSHHVALAFDHLPGTVKVTNVASMIRSKQYTLADVVAEIAKCEVVCTNCHAIRTHTRKYGKA